MKDQPKTLQQAIQHFSDPQVCIDTVAAMRCNPLIRSFYRHLRGQGKPAKVALTASMRKLLVSMNAMLKLQQPLGHIT